MQPAHHPPRLKKPKPNRLNEYMKNKPPALINKGPLAIK
ncbi:hypothetical protein BLL52_2412 [Rhodoferax antarcticus ANT.BR]|uniref:Uncharacterized protein n=1 Tax=Rhodoferax antarcticus ANT.BR TaxID=1111071 RepID=A0A1Q8YDQ1_9BURK|nr:hypothetical protein BLL52_2412 [Rhodoferax antarcticus ANT.BR]